MHFKENQKSLFEEKFSSLDISNSTSDSLMNIIDAGKVILSIEKYDNNKCQVRSYALHDGKIMCYIPAHILDIMEKDTFRSETFSSDNLEDWRKKFAEDAATIGIWDERYLTLIDDKQVLYECVFEGNSQTYISEDSANFHGPLECNFMELWLSLNENYYI